MRFAFLGLVSCIFVVWRVERIMHAGRAKPEMDLPTVYRAIEVFYSGVNNSEAQTWLGEFQKSAHAWTVCDQILGARRDPLTTCFAAQTLRQKILKDLHELPKETLLPLRESLISHLLRHEVLANDQVSDATATQLCLAIADLYIQVPEWTDFIAELLNKFTVMEGDRTRMLLTLLKVLPEETESAKVGHNRREQVSQELAHAGGSVIVYLSSVLSRSQHDSELLKRVLRCLSSFLHIPSLETSQLGDNPLITSVFHILASPSAPSSLHDAATEVVVSALYRAEDLNKHEALARSLQQNVYRLDGAYAEAMREENIDRLANFGRIYVEMCESLIERIVNDARPASETGELGCLHSVDLLLRLGEYHDYSLIEMTFNIWYRISEALFMIDDDDHVAKFKPAVGKYLVNLYRHARYAQDEEGIPDPTSDFAEFRLKVAETVKDVVYIVQSDECIRSMFALLQQCGAAGGGWEDSEAALYVIAHVINNLVPEEESVVPQLLSALVSLPASSHPALLNTGILLLGGCNEWLQKHPQYHDGVLQWLIQLVGNPQYAQPAAESIDRICERHTPAMSALIGPLLSVVPQLEASASNAGKVEAAITHILKAATTLCMQLDEASVQQRMAQMCDPIVERLGKCLVEGSRKADENADAWVRLASEPVLWLDRVSTIFKEVRPWQPHNNGHSAHPPAAPWLSQADRLWQVLSACCRKHASESRVIEHACRAIRHVVRSLGVQSMGMVEPLVNQMVELYTSHRHSCLLYLASILVDEYGAMDALKQGLVGMLVTLAGGSLEILRRPHGFRDNPDTVDDLFRLALRFVVRCPSTYFVHPLSALLMDCAIAGLSVDHQEANRSITKFLQEIMSQILSARKAHYRDEGVDSAEAQFAEKGGAMMSAALKAALFQVTGNLRRDMAEIIFVQRKVDQTRCAVWLRECLSSLPTGGLHATPQQLDTFYHAVQKETDTRGVYGLIRDLVKLYS